jgi:hypothetical protein
MWDLKHHERVAAILKGIPADTDIPHALVALEDAYVCLAIALKTGVSVERACEMNRELIEEERQRQQKEKPHEHL